MSQTTAARLAVVQARITAIDAQLDQLASCMKPTYTVDGQTFKWNEFRKGLREERAELLAECDRLTDIQGGHGFEQTQVFVEG